MNSKTADFAGLKIFYREAGDPSQPTIVLLHGFPSSSYSFHDLIPLLAGRFHVIAPDYPGMGYSEAPPPTVLRPTFDDMVGAIDAFIAHCAPGPVILYMHDIGGPIGMRIATAHPDRIAGLIFQNFTISIEGWNPERLKAYEQLTLPLVDYYGARGRLIEVNGDQPVEAVAAQMFGALENVNRL